MNIRSERPVLMAVLLAFLAGLAPAFVHSGDTAAAQQLVLPPIFEDGARLLTPLGKVEVLEVMAPWIRVKSLHRLAGNDGDQWIFVPAVQGSWMVDPDSSSK